MINDMEMSSALLPVGFCDLLPVNAEVEARGLHSIMDTFVAFGYERVNPPLLEFEKSILAHAGTGVAEQTFRLMDPETHYMMGLRSDITPQIARIATTRLINSPRPLRLSYSGPCVWVSGTKNHSTRQILQAGIELIGVDSPQADAEIITITSEALKGLGIKSIISFDLLMPQLAQTIIYEAKFTPASAKTLFRALDRKDVAAVKQLAGPASETLITMLEAAGPIDRAFEMLKKLHLSPEANLILQRLFVSAETIKKQNDTISLTIDPVEFRGWNYHTGLCISVYIEGISGEVGRGGRYLSNNGEAACGMTLRPDILLQAVNIDMNTFRKIYIPFGNSIEHVKHLRHKGYSLVMGLEEIYDDEQEAKRLDCHFIYKEKSIMSLMNKEA
ncbi:ATP phosphoribosyltransferase regulatory subunit [Commensalibacter sp. Nvir]|nr:ATP phosphoribosyltransferase regulatory subunit [Commensalibacter sp. Nvir]